MTLLTPTTPTAPTPYNQTGSTLVDQGFSAIPCRPGSKRPGSYSYGQWYGRNDWQQYCNRLPTDYETRAWERWPDAGVCVALGYAGLIAIDIDTDDPELCAALAAVIPESPIMKRGQKGFTAFYTGPDTIKSAAFNVNNERVVDLLAHGKQTVVPPTIHPETQKPYQWIGEALESTTPDRLPTLPPDIAERIAEALAPFGYAPTHTPRPQGEGYGHSIWRDLNAKALENLDAWVPALDLPKCKRTPRGYVAVPFWRPSNRGRPTHQRNPNLKITRDGIKDFHDGDRGYTALDVVMEALGCGLDFADEWLRGKLGYQEPDLYGLEAWFPKVAATESAPEQSEPQPVAAPRATVNPFAPSAAGGLLHAISQWVLDNGRRPVPEYAIMAATTFLAGLYGRRCVGPTGAGLNVYFVGLGSSAHGKGHPLKALKTLAVDTGLQQLVVAGDFTADSAIERALRRSPSMVVAWDEFGLVLQGVNGKNASSWTRTVRRALLEVYSLSADMWTGKQYADPKRDDPEPIFCPTLSILGMTTPSTFYDGLADGNLSDGFLNRMTVIHATETPERRKAPPVMITPPSLQAEIKAAANTQFGRGNLAGANHRDSRARPPLHVVEWESPAVEARWLEIEDWQIAEIEERNGVEGIIGRTAEQTIKLATIRALSRDGARARVTLDDVEWGYAVVQRSLDCLDRGVREHMASSEFESLCKAIVAALRKSKDGAMPMGHLLRIKGISRSEDRHVNAAIDRLVRVGDVVRTRARNGGQGLKLAELGDDEIAA
ncbi:conserved hypothetical protein [Hyphomicrobiales bacterium]|nr:conserved hypothetical protein [Hyphomicrobiales bacterium]CAH1669339.1 conserved hypothetical protein [Hyphomicrobiales bacterium]